MDRSAFLIPIKLNENLFNKNMSRAATGTYFFSITTSKGNRRLVEIYHKCFFK